MLCVGTRFGKISLCSWLPRGVMSGQKMKVYPIYLTIRITTLIWWLPSLRCLYHCNCQLNDSSPWVRDFLLQARRLPMPYGPSTKPQEANLIGFGVGPDSGGFFGLTRPPLRTSGQNEVPKAPWNGPQEKLNELMAFQNQLKNFTTNLVLSF